MRHGLPFTCTFTKTFSECQLAMSSVRISFVWLFGNVINYFKFIDLKKIVKIIGKVCWKIVPTILYGNTTSSYFQSEHPNLNDERFFVEYFMLYLLK